MILRAHVWQIGFWSSLHLHFQAFSMSMAVKEEIPFVAPQSTDPYMVGFVREAMDAAVPGQSHAQCACIIYL